MSTLTQKRGDTFRLAVTYQEGTPEVPTSLTDAGVVPRAQLRNGDTLVMDFAITIEDQVATPGRFTLSASAEQTKLWPVGRLEYDIQFTADSGDVMRTPTSYILVLQAVTR